MSCSKNINSLKIGIAISTYSEEKTDQSRYAIIEKSLHSLQNILKTCPLNVYVVLVVDGPIPQKHTQILNKFDFPIHQKKVNGGVARAKNTSIRLLLEQNIDLGFLADDDVLYKPNCIEKYVNVIQKGNIHHIGFCQMHPLVHPKNEWKKFGYIKTLVNDVEVMKHGGGGVGCWLSFTPELIKKIGYFKVMEGKYGYEHINFTHRCIHHKMIPHAIDIVDPFSYMDHIGFEPIGYNTFKKSHSISEETRICENQKNKNVWNKNLNLFVECIE